MSAVKVVILFDAYLLVLMNWNRSHVDLPLNVMLHRCQKLYSAVASPWMQCHAHAMPVKDHARDTQLHQHSNCHQTHILQLCETLLEVSLAVPHATTSALFLDAVMQSAGLDTHSMCSRS